ncbi:MAG: MEDS domain-containing protein [Pseudonocardia sp.]
MTTASISMGVPGVSIAPGDHICAFYRGTAQRDEVLVPFLREGILAGDKCLCVMDDPETSCVLGPLSADVDVEAVQRSGQFALLGSDEAYLPGGSFVPDRMLGFWESGFDAATRADGFGFVRAVGEMTWALRDLPGVEHLVTYEGKLNRFLLGYPQTVLLCLYDLERFTDGQVLMGLLRTHPKVLMSGQLLDNPWYAEPDDFLADLG